MSPELTQAVETLYAAFGDIRRPDDIAGCPCCIDDKGVSTLLRKPLRELTPDDLTHYAASVFLTVDGEGFLYFLPRIMEILVSGCTWWPDVEVVGRAIHDSEFASWPERHRAALLIFIDAVLDEAMLREDGGRDVDSWICALGHFLSDLSPVLGRLSQNPQGLIKYYERNSECLLKKRLHNDFWDDTSATYKQVLGWFTSDKTRKLINQIYGL